MKIEVGALVIVPEGFRVTSWSKIPGEDGQWMLRGPLLVVGPWRQHVLVMDELGRLFFTWDSYLTRPTPWREE